MDGRQKIMSKISVVMPVRNHGQYILAALDSINRQVRKPDEVIIYFDGHQDDDGQEKALAWMSEMQAAGQEVIVFHNASHQGIHAAIGKLLEMATGDLVCCFAADDLLYPYWFFQAERLMTVFPEAAFVSAVSRVLSPSGAWSRGLMPLPENWPLEDGGYMSRHRVRREHKRMNFWVAGNVVVYRRNWLKRIGFREELGCFCDGFAQMVLSARHGCCFLPIVSGAWRSGSGTVSKGYYTNKAESWLILKNASELMKTEFKRDFAWGYADRWLELKRYDLQTYGEGLAAKLAEVRRLSLGALWFLAKARYRVEGRYK
uniref:Putative glycosyltransferase n=2 Tax=viral metagenome TaxID=1070528 RepID=A0A6M3L961_9ZZZZ